MNYIAVFGNNISLVYVEVINNTFGIKSKFNTPYVPISNKEPNLTH